MARVNLPIKSRGPGDPNDFADVYNNDAAIILEVNGNLDDSNIAAAAGIVGSKLADASVTAAKLAAGVPVPTGSLFPYAGASSPTGYLLCDGSAVSRTTYSALFTAIGTAYGTGDGTTTFNLPDLRGRVPTGKGTHADVDTLGESDGLAVGSRSVKHTHGDGSLAAASHTHGYLFTTDGPSTFEGIANGTGVIENVGSSTHTHAGGGTTDVASTTDVTGSTASAHPSFVVVNYIVKT